MQIKKSYAMEMGPIAIEAIAENNKLSIRASVEANNQVSVASSSLSEEEANDLVRAIRSAQNHAFGNPIQLRRANRSVALSVASRANRDANKIGETR